MHVYCLLVPGVLNNAAHVITFVLQTRAQRRRLNFPEGCRLPNGVKLRSTVQFIWGPRHMYKLPALIMHRAHYTQLPKSCVFAVGDVSVWVWTSVGAGGRAAGDCRRETRVWSWEDKCAQRREPPAQSEGNITKRNSVNSDIEVSPSFKSVACCTCWNLSSGNWSSVM